jgi:signal transduction histidine kinase
MGPAEPADDDVVAKLTGVRSSKPNYYSQYRDTAHSLNRSVRALESASSALASVAAGPEQLVEVLVGSALQVFDAPWALVLVDHEAFANSPHLTITTTDGRAGTDSVPIAASRFVDAAFRDQALAVPEVQDDFLAVLLRWEDGGSGWLATGLPAGRVPDEMDHSLLSTLGHQMVAAVRSAHLFAQAEQLRDQASQLYVEASNHARSLAEINERLRHVRLELARAREQQLINQERERIARDLHDMVAQQVLALGLKIEWCRAAVQGTSVEAQLLEAKELARATIERIRATIFDLTSEDASAPNGLVACLDALVVEFRRANLDVVLETMSLIPGIPLTTRRALVAVAHEALANVAFHANATSAWIQVEQHEGGLQLAVDDNGAGGAGALRDHLRLGLYRAGESRHRGLANSYLRLQELGGTLEIKQSEHGGIRIVAIVPADLNVLR